MRRNEAENLIGKLVITDLVKGGYYIGELIEIIPSKPFRANVKIKGVYKYPSLYNHNTLPLCFTGKSTIISENEIINTGNGIKQYTEELISYNHTLKKSLEDYLSSVQGTLSEFIKNEGNYSTWYINNMEDCEKLKDILVQKIKNIIE